jgi:hypothetical protein
LGIRRGIDSIRFPRTWKKGTQQEMKILAAQLGDEERAEKQKIVDGGETTEGAEESDAPRQPPKAFVYTPPAYATY